MVGWRLSQAKVAEMFEGSGVGRRQLETKERKRGSAVDVPVVVVLDAVVEFGVDVDFAFGVDISVVVVGIVVAGAVVAFAGVAGIGAVAVVVAAEIAVVAVVAAAVAVGAVVCVATAVQSLVVLIEWVSGDALLCAAAALSSAW